MEMVIGGACQGKSAWAERNYPSVTWQKGEELDESGLFAAEGVIGFHKFIRKELQQGRDVSGLADRLVEKNPGIILVTDEVGYGVVPMDAFERAYREAVGRVCTSLAAHSSRVTRVVCGIGTVIREGGGV